MEDRLRKLLKNITPPVIWSVANSFPDSTRRQNILEQKAGEKGPEWYDRAFEAADHWKSHYSQSPYYFLWTVIAERIGKTKRNSILDIGCGSGQLACLLRDRGIKEYHGLDFSLKRIERAREVCPEFMFTVGDAFRSDLFSMYNYDVVICTEFLEHVEGDIEIIERIRPGACFHGTVPNFPYISHVRHFLDENEVRARYMPFFSDFHVDSFLANAQGKTFYLIEGLKK
jgi:SAM-dependent methyltransferase